MNLKAALQGRIPSLVAVKAPDEIQYSTLGLEGPETLQYATPDPRKEVQRQGPEFCYIKCFWTNMHDVGADNVTQKLRFGLKFKSC